jgi:hypothetical protein
MGRDKLAQGIATSGSCHRDVRVKTLVAGKLFRDSIHGGQSVKSQYGEDSTDRFVHTESIWEMASPESRNVPGGAYSPDKSLLPG